MAGSGDHFEALGLERRVDLSAGTLRQNYDERCREVHPDAGGEAGAFDTVAEAYACLSSPSQRLFHWLELAGVEVVKDGSLPAPVVDRFGVIGELLREADELAERHREAQSILARSLVEAEGIALQARLSEARVELEGVIEGITARFAWFDEKGALETGEEALEMARTLTFMEKWEGQLRAAWAQAGCW